MGRTFTSTPAWSLSLTGERFVLETAAARLTGGVLKLSSARVQKGFLWASFVVPQGKAADLVLGGLPNEEAVEMLGALRAAIAQAQYKADLKALEKRLVPALTAVVEWVASTRKSFVKAFETRGWLSHEMILQLNANKPSDLDEVLQYPELAHRVAEEPDDVRKALDFWRRPLPEIAQTWNSKHLARVLVDDRSFFDSVESSPLTQEQAEAVVCFDNRVLLVASAGSGKTSTMVAKAAYALHRGYFESSQILLLAFNNKAAAELQARIEQRFRRVGLDNQPVAASTFHSFGLDVIGAATGKKPSLASWVDQGSEDEKLQSFVDELRATDVRFRAEWDLFRFVLGRDLPAFGKEQEEPEDWDPTTRRAGFRTAQGEVVKSRGELLIANWLFFNGVDYVYEAAYKVDTADAAHRQYFPDFYLPQVDAYLEHWALNAQGKAPEAFTGYMQGMAWKRGVHAANGTKLLQTTMAGVWSGEAWEYLERELKRLGLELKPDPERDIKGRSPVEAQRLLQTIRAFLTHVKCNRLSMEMLRARLQDGVAGDFRFRHQVFLNIFEKLWNRWERLLREERVIDFDDMLNQAADCIEQGKWESPYQLVMVDEFQDSSQARARLIAALVAKPGKHLFAVGDDWQSINRFAGADLAVMTDFEQRFGSAVTLKLETTFRCPQALCDISGRFVQKNPQQLRKTVRSAKATPVQPLRIIGVDSESAVRGVLEAYVASLAAEHAAGAAPVRVLLLGRYRKQSSFMPGRFDTSKVSVEFATIHASKGREADHVLVVGLTNGRMGFPSLVEDDPVLRLAMPSADTFEFSEERRLFYVALTRAKVSVTLVTVTTMCSAFVTELQKDFNLPIESVDGGSSGADVCKQCGMGLMVPRKSKYGLFMGCSNFPRCRNKQP